MPRLKGKSSQGSNPITALPRTLSWMPHCCPQKQQCVFTSLSGASALVPRVPGERCGPKASMIRSSSTGSSATLGLLALAGPSPRLRETEEGATAAGTDLLVVTSWVRSSKVVPEAELPLDGGQIADHGHGREGTSAADAGRLLASFAEILVEPDAELRRP